MVDSRHGWEGRGFDTVWIGPRCGVMTNEGRVCCPFFLLSPLALLHVSLELGAGVTSFLASGTRELRLVVVCLGLALYAKSLQAWTATD